MTSKYASVPTTVDGIRFASKKEAQRYRDLCLLQKAGEISGLACQVPFDLKVNGKKVCRYVADFVYFDKTGHKVIEDVKGCKKGCPYQLFRLKAKLMQACLGFTITES